MMMMMMRMIMVGSEGCNLMESRINKDIEIVKEKDDHIELEENEVPGDIYPINSHRIFSQPSSRNENFFITKVSDLNNSEDQFEAFQLPYQTLDLNIDSLNDKVRKVISIYKEVSSVESSLNQIDIPDNVSKFIKIESPINNINDGENLVRNELEIVDKLGLIRNIEPVNIEKIGPSLIKYEEFIDKKSTNVNTVQNVDEEEKAHDPDNREINCDCPCCEKFKLTFSCFVFSKNDPRESEFLNHF